MQNVEMGWDVIGSNHLIQCIQLAIQLETMHLCSILFSSYSELFVESGQF